MIDYDSELRHHHQALCRVLDVQRHDRVLDVGCGAGQTTRDVARLASNGGAIGIDTAESALQQARELTFAAGMRNAEYVRGDAARLPFLPASFDVAISRFGTMFFADPAPAFRNIREALRPGGRLAMMVWQAAHNNAWAVAIHRALVGSDTALPGQPLGPSAFSLGEKHTVLSILHEAAFVDIEFELVDAPVYYGPDVETAFAFVAQFSNVVRVVEAQAPDERKRTVARLREAMAAHQTRDGVWFDSRAWIVTAQCDVRGR